MTARYLFFSRAKLLEELQFTLVARQFTFLKIWVIFFKTSVARPRCNTVWGAPRQKVLMAACQSFEKKTETWVECYEIFSEINCGSPGILPNGWLEGTRTTLHAVVTFRCQEGMTFEGPSYRTICQADGRWSHPLPRCYGTSSWKCVLDASGMHWIHRCAGMHQECIRDAKRTL